MAASRRGTGWKPDVADARDFVASERFGLASIEPPDEASLEDHVGEIYDQGQTNSCVAWALCNAIMIAEAAAGLNPILPSALFAYYNGRRATAPNAPILLDVGSRPRDVVKAAFRLGICDDADWSWDYSRLRLRKNRRPPFAAYMKAHGRRGGEYAKIASVADAKILDVRRALAAGYPVMVALRITQEFVDGQGIIDQPRITDPIIGGHMVALVGYEPDRNLYGQTLFRVLNSWGDRWADDGFGWITEGYLRSGYASDLYVVRAWERIQKARAAKESGAVA